jgi:hypothetical protein
LVPVELSLEQFKAPKLSLLQLLLVPILPQAEKFKELVAQFSVLIEEALQLKQEQGVACVARQIMAR